MKVSWGTSCPLPPASPVGQSEFQGGTPVQAGSETNLTSIIPCRAHLLALSLAFPITNRDGSSLHLGSFAFPCPSTALGREAG